MALLLAVGPAARGEPIFGPATPVAEWNTGQSEFISHVSADGLTAIVIRQAAGGQFDMMLSTRASTAVAWSSPSATVFAAANSAHFNIESAVLSQDGLELLYGYGDTTSGNPGIVRATRASTAAAFPAGSLLTPEPFIASNRFHGPDWLSPDGLRLYLHHRGGSNPGSAIYVTERATTGGAFGDPTTTNLAAVNGPGNAYSVTLTPDELQIIFASDRPGGLGGVDLWWASRPDVSSPFGAAVNLSSVNTAAGESTPKLSGDTLYFSRNGDIYSARIVPEPSAYLLFSLGAAGLALGRRIRRRA